MESGDSRSPWVTGHPHAGSIMARRRASLKFRAEFYSRKYEYDTEPQTAAAKAFEDGYKARCRDEKANKKKKAP